MKNIYFLKFSVFSVYHFAYTKIPFLNIVWVLMDFQII